MVRVTVIPRIPPNVAIVRAEKFANYHLANYYLNNTIYISHHP